MLFPLKLRTTILGNMIWEFSLIFISKNRHFWHWHVFDDARIFCSNCWDLGCAGWSCGRVAGRLDRQKTKTYSRQALESIKYWLSYLQLTGGKPYNWKCEMKYFCFQLCALALRAELIEGKTKWIHFRYIRSEMGPFCFAFNWLSPWGKCVVCLRLAASNSASTL